MYYRLTYRLLANKKGRGDAVLCGFRPLMIGQTVSCDVKLPESDDVAPQVFAVILPNERRDGWYLVKRTDTGTVEVNGQQVAVAQALNNGDLLTFSDGKSRTAFCYELCEDGEYHSKEGVVYLPKPHQEQTYWLTAAWSCVAVVIVLFAFWMRHDNGGQGGNLDCTVYEHDVYQITTDSVFIVCDTLENGVPCKKVLKSAALEHPGLGTCFLTDEGLLVTARHCVEPWIVDHDEWDGQTLDEQTPIAVRMAVEVENWNRQGGQPRLEMASHCVVSFDDGFEHFHSTDFHMNKTRDQVVCLGTDANPLFWRTIMPMGSNRDMELGDFAYTELHEKRGKISLASIEDLRLFEKQHNKNVAVLGFPISDNANNEMVSVVYGNSQHVDFADSLSTQGCLKMSASIGDGNSGGPVFAYVGDSIKAIGIVSKGDGVGTYTTFWAVPTSEIIRMYQQGGVAEENDLIFRR